jgi:hypothetical protein
MRWALPVLCLLGAGGLWAWAVFAEKAVELEPLPQGLAGRYVLMNFEPPKGQRMMNPLPPGEGYLFTFREDGTYAISVFIHGGHEILRRQGIVTVDATRNLVLKPLSTNLRPDEAPPERYQATWGSDDQGPFVALREAEHGYTLHLRQAPPDPSLSSGR